jgi:cell shape-determining protein MreC
MHTEKRPPSRPDSFHSFRQDVALRRKKHRVLFVCAVLAILLLLLRTPVEHYLSAFFHRTLGPVLRIEVIIYDAWASQRAYFLSKKSLLEDNVRLKQTIDSMLAEGYAQEILRQENRELKAVLGRETERSLLLARVLAAPGMAPYDTLIIDVGEDAGLFPGVSVFADGDFLIGEVSQVFQQSAIVTLYSSSGNALEVRLGATSTPTLAHGAGGGTFRATVPKGLQIGVGDTVEVPAISPSFVGVVTGVLRPENSSLQDLFFALPMNVHELRFVYLETSSSSTTP